MTYAGADQRAQRRVDEVQNPAVQEGARDPKEHQDDGEDEQHAQKGSEVKFGLRLDRKQLLKSARVDEGWESYLVCFRFFHYCTRQKF